MSIKPAPPSASWLLSLLAILLAGAAGAARADAPAKGTIRLAVDVSDVERRIFRVREEIGVEPGPLTLYYPKWIPGNHAPTGPLPLLAGLAIAAGGQRLAWKRDPLDMHAFHLVVPDGISSLSLEFQFTSPLDRAQGRIVVTPQMLGLQWNTVVLYPRGVAAAAIVVEPSVTLPRDWSHASALETASSAAGEVAFRPVSLETLVDSPLFAGRHVRHFDLDVSAGSPVRLHAFADAPHLLEADAGVLAAHRNLVVQADRLFGVRHFEHYDFLLALSEQFSNIGLEHHRSSENATYRDYLTAPRHFSGRDLLAHEYVHSWNGKHRRPVGLATGNYDTPMQDDLLWLYEGQTEYWGCVLAARSGLWTAEQARDALADVAAQFAHREGRAWRSLADTTYQPVIAYQRAPPWPNWQRATDYYSEGQLIWLDVDTRLRESSRGRRSLDDFARAFHAGQGGRASVSTYRFEDVVDALERVQPGDWAGFLRARIDASGGDAPLDGLARGGWKLVYATEPTAWQRDVAQTRHEADFSYSLGLVLGSGNGEIAAVLWDSPAFAAGLASPMTVVAVDGGAYDADALARAITDAAARKRPIELLVRDFDRFRTVRIDYHGGLRYPRLERIAGSPDRLGDILAPRR
ncbi:MAG: M61 family metallopeptidase [Xanthomonadales bacterium]|nr:M61 family metallopeptidase [Xanthomonadales bacterium]